MALPFDQTVEVWENPVDPDAEPLATVKGAIWPTLGSSETDRGERYDADGQLEPGAAEFLVGEPNRAVISEGTKYKVVAAVKHTFVPHVEVQLFELRPGG